MVLNSQDRDPYHPRKSRWVLWPSAVGASASDGYRSCSDRQPTDRKETSEQETLAKITSQKTGTL